LDAVPLRENTIPDPPPPSRTILDELRRSEEIAKFLTEKAGSTWKGIGVPIICPLHPEEHPSAAWWRTEKGDLLLRDFHRREGREWFSLAEVAARVLGIKDPAKALTNAAARLEIIKKETEKAVEVGNNRITHIKNFLSCAASGGFELRASGPSIRSHIIYVRYTVHSPGSNPGLEEELSRIWTVFQRHFLSAASRGKLIIALSKRQLASEAGIPPSSALRGARLLALLGLIKPLPLVRGKSDGKPLSRRWVLCIPDEDSFFARLRLLHYVPIHDLNRETVKLVFGDAIAKEVFPG